jgi:tyrosyl-tRNA synthetase
LLSLFPDIFLSLQQKLKSMRNFIEEIKWRGMIHDMIPGTEEYLKNETGVAYVGIDPTADSLHIGHLVSVMMLKHFQNAGHQPIVLVGGATGMIGDPSGKSQERNLLDEDTLRHNQNALKAQLSKLLNFDSAVPNHALMVNNYDWMSKFSFLDFIRDIGKHITVNYMMSKDSVKKRLGEEGAGLSFTEFSYQLVQGVDFWHLYQQYNCKLQMGGSDQWGNITTGTELIRRKLGGDAYAITCPLLTKADGGKFGKTEQGNVWLDASKTSTYAFYQFWLNVSDSDAQKQIKIFTMLSEQEIAELIEKHNQAPHERLLQRVLAREMMIMIHGEKELQTAIEASEVLFGKGTIDIIKTWDEKTLLGVFEGVPIYNCPSSVFDLGCSIIDLLAEHTSILSSKGEARRMLQSNAISVNKVKANDAFTLNSSQLISGKYLIIQTGKKNYHLIVVE